MIFFAPLGAGVNEENLFFFDICFLILNQTNLK